MKNEFEAKVVCFSLIGGLIMAIMTLCGVFR